MDQELARFKRWDLDPERPIEQDPDPDKIVPLSPHLDFCGGGDGAQENVHLLVCR
jgi:hypothetical protein